MAYLVCCSRQRTAREPHSRSGQSYQWICRERTSLASRLGEEPTWLQLSTISTWSWNVYSYKAGITLHLVNFSVRSGLLLLLRRVFFINLKAKWLISNMGGELNTMKRERRREKGEFLLVFSSWWQLLSPWRCRWSLPLLPSPLWWIWVLCPDLLP